MVNETSMLHVAIQNLVVEVRNTNDKVDGLTKEMSILISNQKEIKELRDSLGRVFKRVESIEHHQSNDGCPAHKADMKLSDEKRKGYEKIVKDNEEEHKDFDTRITLLEQKPMKAMDKFTMALIGALGVGFGGWILLKFGVQTK